MGSSGVCRGWNSIPPWDRRNNVYPKCCNPLEAIVLLRRTIAHIPLQEGDMRAREILRAAYGNSRNICTPHIIRVGKLHPRIAYELSSDSRGDYWGVSLVRWEPAEQKATRLYEYSQLFH